MTVIRFRPSRPPRKQPKSQVRPRDYLSEREVESMIRACKTNRHALRDQTLLLIGFRHSLRSHELCGLRWSDVDLKGARLHVRRAKGGSESAHPLSGRERRLLRALRREGEAGEYVRSRSWHSVSGECPRAAPFRLYTSKWQRDGRTDAGCVRRLSQYPACDAVRGCRSGPLS